ncbi:Asp-tRNA(Asn)/Glu-tRNA(Gln) amidotransferase GatCAB subunit C, partial [candidate division KSB1 bacterium]
INKLNELDTDKVKPLYHVLELDTPLREDVAIITMKREEALMNAPSKENGYFKTPKVKD